MMAYEITFGGALYTLFVTFMFGACVGSFLNVCIYRMPRDESVVKPRSHCPNCNTMIAWYDNIPIFSWLLLRAKCRHCGQSIISRYVLVETLVGALFVLVWLLHGVGQTVSGSYFLVMDCKVPIYWLAMSGLVVATFVDFEHFIIPDQISLGGIVAGLLISFALPALHDVSSHWASLRMSVVGLIVGWGSLWLVGVIGKMIFKKDAMGMGDVKLLGAIGAFLGWESVLFTVIISSFAGSFVGIGFICCGNKKWQSRIPYGPYIALGAALWMLWGQEWWQMYMHWVMMGGV